MENQISIIPLIIFARCMLKNTMSSPAQTYFCRIQFRVEGGYYEKRTDEDSVNSYALPFNVGRLSASR
jgi:hypothetical protein